MGFNWEDDNETYRDIPDEVYGQDAPPSNVVGAARQSVPAPQRTPQPQLPVYQEVIEQPNEDEDDSFESVLADANLRIELASLYKLLMNHDFFDETGVDQRAIDTVHRQVRRFARERMEIMLGMRQEAAKEAIVSSPFNDLEVVVLKKMASQMSKGATETVAAQGPQPVAKEIVRREGINKIGAKPANVVAKPQPKQAPAPIQNKPQPLQRQTKPQSQVEIRESAPLDKPISEMSEDEILQRNLEAKARQAGQRSAPSKTAIPMPSPDQEEMLHTHRASEMAGSSNAVSAIVAAINRSKQ